MSIYCLWRYGLNQNYPLPHQGPFFGYECNAVIYLTLWFEFPVNRRNDNDFRRRLKFLYVVLFLISLLLPLEYSVLNKLFVEVPSKYQWILGFFLPIVRQGNLWAATKCSYKAADSKAWSVQCAVSHEILARHALFLALIIGNVATKETTCWILGTDFIINVYLCVKIVYLQKRGIKLKETVCIRYF